MTSPSHSPRFRLASVLTAAGLALAPLPALAAPADGESIEDAPEGDAPPDQMDANRQRAIEAYQRGTELYNAAKFEEALAAFEEAATYYASPDFQFNIAKCYERLGKYEQAIRHYETYLRTTGDTPDRPVIEASIEDLRERLAEAEAEAKKAAEQDQQQPTEVDEPKSPSGRPLVITGGVLLGVGAAVGLGGGLGFGLQVARDNQTLGEVLSTNPDGLTFAEADDLASQARRNQTLEIVMIGVGGALAVTGVALLAVGVKRNKQAASASARVRVAPTWTADGAGLVVQGSF